MPVIALAQITITNNVSDIWAPGKSITDDTTTTPVGQIYVGTASGTAQTFDYSGYTFMPSATENFVSPANI